jgi:hypothetical protein
MKEQQIQAAIIKELEKRGCYTVKIVTATKAGVSDILACHPVEITSDMVGQTVGLFLSLEVKTPKGRVAPLQEYHLDKVREAGGVGEIVRSVGDVRELIDNLGARDILDGSVIGDRTE